MFMLDSYVFFIQYINRLLYDFITNELQLIAAVTVPGAKYISNVVHNYLKFYEKQIQRMTCENVILYAASNIRGLKKRIENSSQS